MTALHLAPVPAQGKSRPSTAMNVIEGDTMLGELREQEAKIEALVAQLQVANTLAADLRLHLKVAGRI